MKDDLEAVRCVGKRTLATLLEVSPHTITDWCKAGKFPPPFRAMPGAPDRWRLKDVEEWIAKCKRSRAKQKPRGMFAKPTSAAEPAPKEPAPDDGTRSHAHDAAHDGDRRDDGADKDAVRAVAFAAKFRGAITPA